MTREDCLRVLNLTPSATPEQIRRAYLDLARVWHPDRFESDPRLRSVAEQQLKQITEAYHALKSGAFARASQSPPRYASQEPPTPTPASAPSWTPPPPFQIYASARSILRASLVLAVCLMPIILGTMLLSALRVPGLERITQLRPRVLEPMAIIDRYSDTHIAAGMLSEWADGGLVHLWSSSAKPLPIPTPAIHAHSQPRAFVAVEPTPPLPNGTELIATGARAGSGELRIANAGGLEAVVFLVHGERAAVRAIYLLPGSEASLRSIATGTYSAHVERGKNLDQKRLRFREASKAERFGPFAFWEVSSADKSFGSQSNRYEIRIGDQTAKR